MTLNLEGRVALVTGGNAGLGKATSIAYAQAGAKVVVNGTNLVRGQETVAEIRDKGGDAIFVRADVSRANEVETMIVKAVDVYGRLDFAFNNAGIEGEGPITHEYPEEVWDRTIAVNLKGVWLCMKYEIIQMLKQGGGSIINMASIGGLVGGASPAYNASKHGVIGLTKSATLIYADKGIRINAVCPAAMRTPMLDRFEELDPPAGERMEGDARSGTVWRAQRAGRSRLVAQLGEVVIRHGLHHTDRRRLDCSLAW